MTVLGSQRALKASVNLFSRNMLSVVLFTMLAVPLVCGLPRPNESNTPLDVSKPKESNGKFNKPLSI